MNTENVKHAIGWQLSVNLKIKSTKRKNRANI